MEVYEVSRVGGRMEILDKNSVLQRFGAYLYTPLLESPFIMQVVVRAREGTVTIRRYSNG